MENQEEQVAKLGVPKDGRKHIKSVTQPTIMWDQWQLDFLNTEGDKQLCTGRQVGKSVVCAKDAGDYAMTHPNEVILMIAPVERQSYALFDKTLAYIGITNKKLLKRGKDRPTKTRIILTNKTVIWCLPVGMQGAGIRFLTVNRLYADEASRIPEDVWSAVEPMLLTTGGNTILLSTPFGAERYFYDCWINKDGAFDSFTRFSIDSETVIKERPICATWTQQQRDKALEKLAQARVRMTELQYSQEYMGQFLHNLRQVYPDELIKECMQLERTQPTADHTFTLGVDIARMGDDDSTFEIFDMTDKDHIFQVDNQVTNKTLLTDTTKHIIALDKIYKFRSIFIDDGGMGVGVFDMLLSDDQTKRKVIAINNMYRPLTRDEKQRKKVIKEDLHNNLLMLMQGRKIQFLKDERIFESLKSIQFELKDGVPKYSGTYSHIADGMIRGAWEATQKKLQIYIY